MADSVTVATLVRTQPEDAPLQTPQGKTTVNITSPAAAPTHPGHAKFVLGLIAHLCLDSLPIVLKLIPTPSADTTIALEGLAKVVLEDAAAAVIQVAAETP